MVVVVVRVIVEVVEVVIKRLPAVDVVIILSRDSRPYNSSVWVVASPSYSTSKPGLAMTHGYQGNNRNPLGSTS